MFLRRGVPTSKILCFTRTLLSIKNFTAAKPASPLLRHASNSASTSSSADHAHGIQSSWSSTKSRTSVLRPPTCAFIPALGMIRKSFYTTITNPLFASKAADSNTASDPFQEQLKAFDIGSISPSHKRAGGRSSGKSKLGSDRGGFVRGAAKSSDRRTNNNSNSSKKKNKKAEKEQKDGPRMTGPSIQFRLSEESTDLFTGEANCQGCGAKFQLTDPSQPGYVKKSTVDAYIEASHKAADEKAKFEKMLAEMNAKEAALRAEGKTDEEILTHPDLILDAAEVKAYEKSIKIRPLVCERCHNLSFHSSDVGKTTTTTSTSTSTSASASSSSSSTTASSSSASSEPSRRRSSLSSEPGVAHVELTAEDFHEKLKQLSQLDVLVVKIVDMFDVHGSFVPDFQKLVGNDKNDVLLVGNKADLLPSSAHWDRIQKWLERVARHEFRLQRVVDTMLVSSVTGDNIRNLAIALEKYRKGRNVYVVGATNVGKSTLINKLLALFSAGQNKNHCKLTTSPLPGTTLTTISFPLENAGRQMMMMKKQNKKSSSSLPSAARVAHLFDTPGVINKTQAAHLLVPAEWRYVFPTKRVSPRHFRLRPGRSLFLGGLARIDLVSGPEHPGLYFSAFVSHALVLHATSTARADEIHARHAGGMLKPPVTPERALELGDMSANVREFVFQGHGHKKSSADVVVHGLGWVAITGWSPEIKIRVHMVRGLDCQLRLDPIMPFEAFKLRKHEFKE